MWCLLYIAIAGTAPSTDCSLPSLDECLVRTIPINKANWRENLDEIPYLSLCISSQERAKYLLAQQIEKTEEHN